MSCISTWRLAILSSSQENINWTAKTIYLGFYRHCIPWTLNSFLECQHSEFQSIVVHGRVYSTLKEAVEFAGNTIQPLSLKKKKMSRTTDKFKHKSVPEQSTTPRHNTAGNGDPSSVIKIYHFALLSFLRASFFPPISSFYELLKWDFLYCATKPMLPFKNILF